MRLQRFLAFTVSEINGRESPRISKDIPTTPSHFKVCKGLKKLIQKIDICDLLNTKSVINKYKPDYIFILQHNL